jgi:hypothetical protein
MRRVAACLLSLTFLAAACGDSPTSPSEASTGATINGAIVTPGSGAVSGASVSPATGPASLPVDLIVSVAGTDLTATISPSGTFSLFDVPPGDVDLRFTSSAVSGGIVLADVQQTETIDISVSVENATVTLESQSRSMGSDTELEGRIEALPELTAADDLVVAGRTVLTDEDTTVYFGNTEGDFEDLLIGFRVHVKGTMAGPDLLATVIMVQNTDPDIQYPINGIIEAFMGTEDAFEFTIGRHLIKGDADTEYFGNTEFDDIADGERAEVKAWLRDGYFYAFRLHIESEDEPEEEEEEEEEQEDSASVEGVLSGLGGAPPALTFLVGTTTIVTDGGTVVHRKGDVQTLDELVEGMTVHVVGDRQPDGSIVARKVQIKGDAVGGAFQIEGALGGLQGACPAVSFGVNGYQIVADAATVHDPVAPGCEGLKSGNKVLVDGIVQADGSVLATAIRK